MQYNCFMITPFGQKRPSNGCSDEQATPEEQEEHFLYDLHQAFRVDILKEARSRCLDKGFDVRYYDGTDVAGDGELAQKILPELERAQLCLCLVSGAKPNVYLELGWSTAFWHRPIILYHERPETDWPTDIASHLRIPFKSDAVNGIDAEARESLIDMIVTETIDRIHRSKAVPFSEMGRQSFAAYGRVRVYERFSKGITMGDWTQTILDAKEEIVLATPKLYSLLKKDLLLHELLPEAVINAYRDADQAFEEASNAAGQPSQSFDPAQRPSLLMTLLAYKAIEENVRVRVICQHPEGMLWHQIPVGGDDLEVRQDQARLAIAIAQTQWMSIVERTRAQRPRDLFQVIQIRRGALPFRALWTEKRVIHTMRLLSEDFNSMYCTDADAPQAYESSDNYITPFHTLIKKEVDLYTNRYIGPSHDDFSKKFGGVSAAVRQAFAKS
ncbi:MAG: hypothetical protein AAFR65_02805 [Pseudomonadota bacterium]